MSKLYKLYRKDIAERAVSNKEEDLLNPEDIIHLPPAVKNYIHYSGALGKPKVNRFYVSLSGQLRKNAISSWMPFHSEQHNFLDPPARLFYMKATMNHLPVIGYHCFKNGEAFMDIRLLSLFKVQYQSGQKMAISETVTFFNDMCCLAPGTLIDKRITWVKESATEVEARFTVNNITISAVLYFNYLGQLVNFVSRDRYATMEDGSMKRMRWSTPLGEYREINGFHLAGFAETLYAYPDGDFCYGNFRLRNISCNLQQNSLKGIS